MLSNPLNLNTVNGSTLFDFLYGFFHRDFVANKTLLNKHIHIDPRCHLLDEGKEKSFWHLTTREHSRQVKQDNRIVTVTERLADFRRAERIEWVRQIIVNHSDPEVYCFYHKETNTKRDIRLYLWAHKHDFVVILQKLGRSSAFLVTSFYIDHQGKRDDFSGRYHRYIAGTEQELTNCKWF